MEYILETKALSKRYRNFSALNGLTMHIPKGSIYGFVGRNGAGKTTLIRLICGLQEPSGGEYMLYGIKNKDKKIVEMRRRMGAVVELPAVYTEMTAEENLRQQNNILKETSRMKPAELLELVGLGNTGKKKVKDFSLGMRQRLGIAVVLAGDPEFLVLDEPINGLDPQGIIEMRELILRLNRFGSSVNTILMYAGLSLAMTTAVEAILVLIAMLCSNRAHTAAGCILTVFVLLFLGIYITSALNEPEFLPAYTYIENGVTVEEPETRNPNYVGGKKREVYEFLQDFTSGGQMLQIADMEAEKPSFLALYDGIILILVTGCGLVFFRRRDLK